LADRNTYKLQRKAIHFEKICQGNVGQRIGRSVPKVIPLPNIPLPHPAVPRNRRQAKNGGKKISCFNISAPCFLPASFHWAGLAVPILGCLRSAALGSLCSCVADNPCLNSGLMPNAAVPCHRDRRNLACRCRPPLRTNSPRPRKRRPTAFAQPFGPALWTASPFPLTGAHSTSESFPHFPQ